MEHTTAIKWCCELIDRMHANPDYMGGAFELDNIIYWMKLEIRALETEHELKKQGDHKS